MNCDTIGARAKSAVRFRPWYRKKTLTRRGINMLDAPRKSR
jgi:hypothetical protein